MGSTVSKWYGGSWTECHSDMATKEQYLNLLASIQERRDVEYLNSGDWVVDESGMKTQRRLGQRQKQWAGCLHKQKQCYSLMDRCVEVVCDQLLRGGYKDSMQDLQLLPAEVMQLVVDMLMIQKTNHRHAETRGISRVSRASVGTKIRDLGLGDGHVLYDTNVLRSLEGCEFYDVSLDGGGYARINLEAHHRDHLSRLHSLRQNLFPKRMLERVMVSNKKPLPTARRTLYTTSSLYDDGFFLQYVMGCEKLRELHIGHCDDVTEKSLSLMLRGLPLLEVLCVKHCHNIKDMMSHVTVYPSARELAVDASKTLSNLHTVCFESCLRLLNLGKFLSILGANKIVTLQVSCCSLVQNNDAVEIAYLRDTLEVLNIGNTGITDNGLKCLGALENLKRFEMPGLRVRDSSIAYCIKHMRNLEELDVSRCCLAGDGTLASLAEPSSMPCSLKSLRMMFTNITDDGLSRSLPYFSGLDYINVESCNVSDVGLIHLKHAKHLRAACLSDTQAGNDTMEALSHLKKLSILDVSFTNSINNIGLKYIGRMHGLNHLVLESLERCSKDGFKHLTFLQCLESLNIFGCQVTDDVCSLISKIISLKRLDVGWGEMTSAGVKELSRLPKLKHLSLAHCRCIRDDSMPFLLNMKRLSSLNLSECRISDTTLPLLSNLPRLKVLCLADTPIKCHILEDLVERNHTLEIKGLK